MNDPTVVYNATSAVVGFCFGGLFFFTIYAIAHKQATKRWPWPFIR